MNTDTSSRDVEVGGQGCVYTGKDQPVCMSLDTNTPVNSSGQVTKVYLSTGEYEIEKKIVKILEAIDPNRDYIVYPSEFCKVKKSDLDECVMEMDSSMVATQKEFYASVIPKMDETLEYQFDPVRFKRQDQAEEILHCFKNLCMALKVLHSNGLVYVDIKRNNVMVKDGRYKFIDVGYIKKIDADTFTRKFLRDVEYHLYCPACVHVRNVVRSKNGGATADAIPSASDLLDKYTDRLIYANPSMPTLMSTTFYDPNRLSDLDEFQRYYARKPTDEAMIRMIMTSQDIYALGIMMIYMIATRLVGTHFVRIQPLVSVIKRCVRQNPVKRPTIEELILLLEDVQIDKYDRISW